MKLDMNFTEFQNKVDGILKTPLPRGETIVAEGRAIAADTVIGRTLFMDEMGVSSEAEYKQRCIRDGRIMFHAHIGLNSWASTAEALTALKRAADAAGFIVDRAGICLDRRMGLPKSHREGIPAETGPMLETPEDWMQIGQVSAIQPHMGDFMVGFPAATENTVNALKAGVTSIGNLSQFFSHEVPMWRDPVTTATETVRAIAIMGALREQGTLMHSYLEDGYGALFYDCATVAGWACLERYIVEAIIGAKLAHCIGGLTSDPVKRAGWVFALNRIHDQDCLGTMIYGNTISSGDNFAANSASVGEYLLWDIMAQMASPTGHAVHPLPVTEAIRIPSAQEIVEAQAFGRRVEKTARRLHPHVDFSASYAFADTVTACGKTVCHSALDGLKQAGVDIKDPVQLLFVLKRLGPAVFEEMFGAGDTDDTAIRGRRPKVMTDIFMMSKQRIDQYRALFQQPENRRVLKDRRLLIASSDVHEHAILILDQLCRDAGAHTVYLGAEQDPDQIVAKVRETRAEALLISTHNGMALDYSKRLKAELKKRNLNIPVIMGGILNQKMDGQALPVDVSRNIKELGFYPSAKLEGRLNQMLDFADAPETNKCHTAGPSDKKM
jgi:methylmalonyl-CoA mutase cobalamin-binding subunit